jgi:signal transduction histidine kinase
MSRLSTRIASIYATRRTVRARFALLYAGLFFVLGFILLAIPAGFVHSSSSRVSAVHVSPSSSTLGSSVAESQHSTDVHNVLIGSLIALVLLAVAAAVLGWFLAGRLLRPLRAITENAREISASNLHRRLDLAGPDDEFKELGLTLDDLFGRLEASFEAQRRFVANASHELRTPLAAERTVLQVALADPAADTSALRAACEQVIALGEQQERLISALLTLATTERGIERRQPCNLSSIAAAAVQARGSETEQRGLHALTSYGVAIVDGDPGLLDSLVANLVDNAIRHNVDGGRFEVTTTAVPGGEVKLSVSNRGPIIPPDQIERLFQPFQRLGADRIGGARGHGIGLAVVHAISLAHGATISAVPRAGGGLDIDITFPRSTRPLGP